ncbi:MAG: hypothetical protein LBW85_10740 [Deltaproteobacteria bacterium]|jgi:hypothetical protein|nr:hypothetical protein [Deltaproteobacteria bacterium]
MKATSALRGALILALAGAAAALALRAAHSRTANGPGSPETEWERTYGGSGDDGVYSVSPASDGGFALAGFTLSGDGRVPGRRAAEDAWILRIGPDGSERWQTVLGGSGKDLAYSVSQAADGGFIAAGSTWSADGQFPGPAGPPGGEEPPAPGAAGPAPARRGWAARLEADGSARWIRTYGRGGISGLSLVSETADGGLLAAGDAVAAPGLPCPGGDSFDVWLLRLSPEGDVLWEKCLGTPFQDIPLAVLEAEGGEAVLAASVWTREGSLPPGAGAWAAAVGPAGDALWSRTYAEAGAERAFSLRAAPSGGYMMAGFAGGPPGAGDRRSSALRIRADGTLQWALPAEGAGRLADLIPAPEGGFFAVYLPYRPEPGESADDDHDLTVVRVGDDGARQWQGSYGSAAGRPAAAFALGLDGGLAAAGTVQREAGPGRVPDKDAWVLKLGPPRRPPDDP